MFDSIDDLATKLAATGYFIDPVMTQVVFLAAKLQKPLLLEGPAGSGQNAISGLGCRSRENTRRATPVLPRRHRGQGDRPLRRGPAAALHGVLEGPARRLAERSGRTSRGGTSSVPVP